MQLVGPLTSLCPTLQSTGARMPSAVKLEMRLMAEINRDLVTSRPMARSPRTNRSALVHPARAASEGDVPGAYRRSICWNRSMPG